MPEAIEIEAVVPREDPTPWVAARAGVPGCRRLDDVRVVAVLHAARSTTARACLEARSVPWPALTGETVGDGSNGGVVAMRHQPEELVLLAPHSHDGIDAVLAALGPGREPDAVAIELTHGALVIELAGAHLDGWLARLVDALAIPRRAGQSTRTRLVDATVVLVRLAVDRIWLVADRSIAAYLADWLAFSHEGAFGAATSQSRP